MDRDAEVTGTTAGRGMARRGIALAALLLTLASGCVGTDQLVSDLVANPTSVTTIAALWKDQLMAGVDPVHHGTPIYGIAGRIFLFGPGLTENLPADGKIVVEMYGLVPEQPQGPTVLLETWEIKKEDLARVCLRKDGLGTGYTLNLPWEHYRPDVRQLDIRTRYEPAKGGMPIYTRDLVQLVGGPGPEVNVSKRVETGDHRVVAATAPPAATQPAGPVSSQQPGAVQQAMYPPAPVTTMPSPFPAVPQRVPAVAPPAVVPPQPAMVQQPPYQAPTQSPYQQQAAPATGGPVQR